MAADTLLLMTILHVLQVYWLDLVQVISAYVFLLFSLSLSLSHTHTYTHTHTLPSSLTHSLSHTHTHTHTNIHTHNTHTLHTAWYNLYWVPGSYGERSILPPVGSSGAAAGGEGCRETEGQEGVKWCESSSSSPWAYGVSRGRREGRRVTNLVV